MNALMCKKTKLVTLLMVMLIISCTNLKTVSFKTPVDTKTKKVNAQIKKTYAINDLGVFASNEFDAARLNGFEKVNDSTVKVIITPENTPINNSAYYSFKTWSKAPKTFYFQFSYPEGFKHRYPPKLKGINSNKWSVIAEDHVFKTENSTTIKLNLTKKPLYVSAQEIVSSTDTYNWVDQLIKGKENFVHYKSVGKSRLGKKLPVLDIYRGEKKNKPIIVLLTRQHPPEVTGFFAYQEFLKTILNESELSNNFLEKYRVLAFPIINPDGVDLGHWRHNAGGVDTNRDWSKYRQPEIKQVVRFISQASKKDEGKIILGLDFHSTYNDVFYTNKIRKETTLPTFIEEWFAALEVNIPDYKVNEAAGNSTKPVSKGWFLYGQKAVGITYEIGDKTPRDKIKIVGKVTSEEMMKILTKNKY
jgi:hypothetical protein